MNNKFDWHIESKSNFFEFRIKELWSYRDLLWLLVRRDVVSFYKQTILGPIWFFLQPLFTTIVFTLVFGKLGGFKTDGIPQPLLYLTGITAWNYFADCITKTSSVFRDNASMFGKVYFPRLIMPLSIVLSNLLKFCIQLILLLLMIAFYVFYQKEQCFPNVYILLFPALILLMALLGLGVGMVISAMTTKYRDLAFLVTFGIQLLMYGTTVVYPLSVVNTDYRWLIELNPMTPIIETFRYGFLGKGSFNWFSLGCSSVCVLFILTVGIIVFNKVERTFVDTI